MTALYGLANTFIIFLGARIVWGISYSFIRQISIIVAAKAGPEGNLGERMGYYRGIGVIWIAAAVFQLRRVVSADHDGCRGGVAERAAAEQDVLEWVKSQRISSGRINS